MEWFVGFPLKDQALAGAPALALCPFPRVSATPPNPAWHPKQPSFWPPIPPTLHQTVPRTPPEPHHSITVVPLIRDPRYYDEAPGGLGGSYGGMSGREGALFPPFHRKQ